MAEILLFRARPRSETDSAPRFAEGAQILFFTGVRYIRWDDAVAPAAVSRKSARRGGKTAAPRKPPRKRA